MAVHRGALGGAGGGALSKDVCSGGWGTVGGHSTAGEGPQIRVRPFLVEKSEATGKQLFLQFNWAHSVTCFRNILFNL